jgi:hypothetical protein
MPHVLDESGRNYQAKYLLAIRRNNSSVVVRAYGIVFPASTGQTNIQPPFNAVIEQEGANLNQNLVVAYLILIPR